MLKLKDSLLLVHVYVWFAVDQNKKVAKITELILQRYPKIAITGTF